MRRAWGVALFMALAAVLAAAAQAKGPTSLTIDGPGLAKPIRLQGNAEGGSGSVFYDFVQEVGFFPTVFCCDKAHPLLARRPGGKLGLAYTITYVVPTGEPKPARLTEELYPYANGGPVVHMSGGEPLFGTQAHGGWFRPAQSFDLTLFKLGIPREQPNTAALSSVAWAGIGLGGFLVLLAGLALARRQRQRLRLRLRLRLR